MFTMRLIFAALILNYLYKAECARILGIFPFGGTSHYILGNSLMKGLAEAGHDVTMISPFEEKNPPGNGSYRDIVLTGFAENFKNFLQKMNLFEFGNQGTFGPILFMPSTFASIPDEVFGHENVKNLLNSNEKFDAVITEQFVNDPIKVFAHLFDAPLILLSTVGPCSWVNDIVGNPSPPAYVPHLISQFSPSMSFMQRVHNSLLYLLEDISNHLYFFSTHEKLIKKHFPNSPNIYDIYHNVSLILLNSHESINQAVPLVPNMVQVGGYHIKPPKKLPKDLQEFLDNSKEGVVYFSLGSNLKSKDLPPYKREAFLKAFSKLKENVLWKWEDDVLPGKPSNVKLGKWLPQQDILGHPNVKLFITHGGLLSTTEAIYHGVPTLAIPVFGDQYINAKRAVMDGYALSLPYHGPSFSEEKLSSLLDELLHNPKYATTVKKKSQLFHDRPMKPMESVVYWVEYVVRYRGAPHLRVAGVDLPWYQYLLLDVVVFITGTFILILTLLYIGIRRIFHRKTSRKLKVKKN